jgi:hypothetical protein
MSDSNQNIDQRERWDDREEAGRISRDADRADTWTSMPGIVVAHDREKNTIKVQPALKLRKVKQDGTLEWVQIPELADVPLQYPGGGGATWTFPLKQGDEVLLNFSARNIDKWHQQGGVQEQNVPFRMHDLSDAFAIPGFRSTPRKLENISENAAELRTDDGSLVLQFDPVQKKFTIKSETNAVRIEGNLDVTGEITAKAGTGQFVRMTTHRHLGVVEGPDRTLQPAPGT